MVRDSSLICPTGWKEAEVLERISECFGSSVPEGYGGRPLASSDVVELKGEFGRHYFYADGGKFESVRFSPFLAKKMDALADT